MEWMPVILTGLGTTLFLAFISLLIGSIPGVLLFWMKKSGIKGLYWLSTCYIELFEGIPLLAQLFLIFYALPMISPVLSFSREITAIVVLSLNTAAKTASIAKSYSERFDDPLEFGRGTKIFVLSMITQFGKLIKYTTLLSIIGLTELFRSANVFSNASGEAGIIIAVIAIYLVLHIIIRLIYKGLENAFFGLKGGIRFAG